MPEIKAFSKYLFDETGDKLTFKHNLDVSGDLVIGGNVELSGSNKVVSDVSSSAITAGSVEAGSAVVSGDVAVAGLTTTKYLELNNNVGYMSKSFGDVVYDSGDVNRKGIRVIMNTEALAPIDVSGTLTGGDIGMFAIRMSLHSPKYGNLEIELFGHLDELASSGYRDLGYRVVSLADYGLTIEEAKYYITKGTNASNALGGNLLNIEQDKSYFFIKLSHKSDDQFDYTTITVQNVTPADGDRTQLPIADYVDVELYEVAKWNDYTKADKNGGVDINTVFASGDIPEKPLVIPNVDIVENLNVGGAVDVTGNLTVDGVIKAETLQVNDIHHVTTTASDGDMDLSGNLHVSQDISANGNIQTPGQVSASEANVTGQLTAGSIKFGSATGFVKANSGNFNVGNIELSDINNNSNIVLANSDQSITGIKTFSRGINYGGSGYYTSQYSQVLTTSSSASTNFVIVIQIDDPNNNADNGVINLTLELHQGLYDEGSATIDIYSRLYSYTHPTNDDQSAYPYANTPFYTVSKILNSDITINSVYASYVPTEEKTYLFVDISKFTPRYSTMHVKNVSTGSSSYTTTPIANFLGFNFYNNDATFDTIFNDTDYPNKTYFKERPYQLEQLSVRNKIYTNDILLGSSQFNIKADTTFLYLFTNGDASGSTDWRLGVPPGAATTNYGRLKGDWHVESGDLDITGGGNLNVTGTINGNVTGDLTGQVLTGSQTNINSIGSTGNVVTFPGSITATQGITTNGDVTIVDGGDLTLTGGGTINGSLNGNASTATRLQTTRTIGGVSFDGTANINLPGVNIQGTQGINTTASISTSGNMGCTLITGICRIPVYGSSYWRIQKNGSDKKLYFSFENANGFQTHAATINSDGAYSDINPNFTGQHHNYSPSETVDETYTGFIVSSSGVYRNKFEDGNTRSKSSITINESLPIVVLSGKDKDKKCFGVISDKDDCGNCVEQANGNFVSVFQVKNEDRKLTINSLGEGALWVCDINGAIENGDYITTSVIPGIGMKQDDDLLHNYTVAKITMDCDFAPQLVHQNKLKLDASGNPTLDEATQEFEFEMAYDESGNPVMEEEYDMKYVKINTSNYVVYNDAALTEEFLRYDHDFAVAQPALVGQVFKMAFVGCTYHCG